MDDATPSRFGPRVQIDTGPAFHKLLDQDQATSGLLEKEERNNETTAHSQSNEDDKDDRHSPAFDSISFTRTDDDAKPSTALFYRGNPLYMLTGDVLGILLSGCFLALGICIAMLEDEPENAWSRRVIQATQIAPSIWPIIFSGVLGNTIRTLADWHAERGVSLLSLEQLLGSVTMASSVLTIFRWSIWRTSSVVLLFCWAFNPLGSQASLRSAYLRTKLGESQGLVRFYNNSVAAQGIISVFGRVDPKSDMVSLIPTIYASTLHDSISALQYVDLTSKPAADLVAYLGGKSSAGVQAATDSWGNVRIPNLRYLQRYDPASPSEWLETPWDRKVLNYSSLIGDRIDGVNRSFTGNTTFTIQSSYQDFNCSAWFQLKVAGPSNSTNGTSSTNDTISTGRNSTQGYSPADLWLMENTGRNLTASLNIQDGPTPQVRPFILNAVKPYNITRKFVFAQYRRNSDSLLLTTCTPRTMYIDANITCISKGTSSKTTCGVYALREIPNPPASPNITVFDRVLAEWNKASYIAEALSAGLASGQSSSDAEFYLFDPLSAVSTSRTGTGLVTGSMLLQKIDLYNLDIALFERRFSLLFNTLWKTSWLSQMVMGGNMSSVTDGTGVLPSSMLRNTTTHITFPRPPTYKVNRPWLAMYLISVEVMLLAAMFSLVLRSYCEVPAILGYVSSLTRDSVYFGDPMLYKNSAEDGPAKTRRLGGMRVMIADVGSRSDEVGNIAFAPLGMGERVRKRRWYT